MLMGFKHNDKVYDDADLFTQDEIENLQQRCIELAEETELDIVVVTTDDAQGKTACEYADDFFDYNGFGFEKPMGTGILYLIDMDNREAWVSTSGDAIGYFSDKSIRRITDSIYSYLANGSYYESAETFLNQVEYVMSDWLSGDNSGGFEDDFDYPQYDEDNDIVYGGSDTPAKLFSIDFMDVFIYLIIAIIIGGVSVFIMVRNAGGKVTVNSRTYLNPNGIKVNQKRDVYTHTTTTSRTISDDSDSHSGRGGFSGGSSTHVGSSGNSHGGGGCKF